MSGFCDYELLADNMYGQYWLSTFNPYSDAYYLYFGSDSLGTDSHDYRYVGRSVRELFHRVF